MSAEKAGIDIGEASAGNGGVGGLGDGSAAAGWGAAGSGAAARWHPRIAGLALAPTTPRAPIDVPGLEPWMVKYLSEDRDPAFTVTLPAEREYTRGFRFKPGQQVPNSGGGAQMVSWVAAKGSKVGQLLGLEGFELPNGTQIRLYKAAEERNARAPRDEPHEAVPGAAPGVADEATGAGAVNGLEMPSLTPMPLPSRRDYPRLGLSVHMQYPQPIKHTLKHGTDGQQTTSAEGVWYGTIAVEVLLIGAREVRGVEVRGKGIRGEALRRGEEEGAGESAATADYGAEEEEKAVSFIDGPIDSSCFAPRRATSDARSYWNGPKVTRRAMEIDFSRCNGERFRSLVLREGGNSAAAGGAAKDAGEGEEQLEIEAIKEVLMRHRGAVYTIYTFFCTNGKSHDRFVMGMNEFSAFCRECALAEEGSRFCKNSDLSAIFVAADAEEKKRLSDEQKRMNAANIDHALMRFEWLNALVRIAAAKYVRTELTPSLSLGLERLLVENVLPRVPPEALHDSDVFRRARLYTADVADVFAEFEPSLRCVYEVFSNASHTIHTPIARAARAQQHRRSGTGTAAGTATGRCSVSALHSASAARTMPAPSKSALPLQWLSLTVFAVCTVRATGLQRGQV